MTLPDQLALIVKYSQSPRPSVWRRIIRQIEQMIANKRKR